MSQGWENNNFSWMKREQNEASSKWSIFKMMEWKKETKQSPKSINVWNNKNKKEKTLKLGHVLYVV